MVMKRTWNHSAVGGLRCFTLRIHTHSPTRGPKYYTLEVEVFDDRMESVDVGNFVRALDEAWLEIRRKR